MKEYAVIIALSAIVLFLILGYTPIIKKYLPRRSAYVSVPETDLHIRKKVSWYSNCTAIMTLMMPFVSVRSSAVLRSSNGTNLIITVRAAGRNRAICINKPAIEAEGYYVTRMINLRSSEIIKSNTKSGVRFTH